MRVLASQPHVPSSRRGHTGALGEINTPDGWRLPPHLLLYHQEQTGATKDRLLHRSLTHTIPGAFPQSFYVAYRRRTKELLVLAVEIRGVVIPHAVAGTRGIQPLTEHEPAG